MCLAQGPQRSDASEAGTHGPLISSQAPYHRATALPNLIKNSFLRLLLTIKTHFDMSYTFLVVTSLEYHYG